MPPEYSSIVTLHDAVEYARRWDDDEETAIALVARWFVVDLEKMVEARQLEQF